MSDKIKEAYARIQRYYSSEASVESDLKANRDIIEIYIAIQNVIDKYLDRKLVETGQNGPLRFISTKKLIEPVVLTTNNMILIRSSDILSEAVSQTYGVFNIAICIGTPAINERASGLFEPYGLQDYPTIFVYYPDTKAAQYGVTQVTREGLKKFVKLDAVARRTFYHETRHYFDVVAAWKKNPNNSPLKGYKVYRPLPPVPKGFEGVPQGKIPKELRNPLVTHSYAKYINQSLEVNAIYAEWIISIYYSFERLDFVRKHGIVGAFPSFDDFWTFYWHKDYIPEDMILEATPKTTRYYKKRLYKFYDYAISKERAMTEKNVKDYLKKDRANAA